MNGDWLNGRYEVLRTVSNGSRATVLQGLDHVHDKLVALKVYPLAGTDRDAILAEARVLIDIDPHPALPVVRGDFFTPDDEHYVLVMNWIEGSDLQQVLDDEGDPGLPFDEVREAVTPIAEALDHLHTHVPPIVHGDVKPANLVRSATGKVVLVDFDIAAANAGRQPLGTIGFVAPEVAAGDKPTAASDIYGLAATIVALLDGLPPGAAVPNVDGVSPAMQAHLSRALRAALSTDPANRPRTARKLVESLKPPAGDSLPSGVLAFLAIEVADASRQWDEDPDEMSAAMRRLRDLRTVIVGEHGGLVTSLSEGDNAIVVFREASAAASAARALHARVAREPFPPGIEVRLRAAINVGEATPSDGSYAGPVIEHVRRLRSAAAPGTTLCSEPTAEMLVSAVGRELEIVPLDHAGEGLPLGMRIFELRSGDEPPQAPSRVRELHSTRPSRTAPTVTEIPDDDAVQDEPAASGRVVATALSDPSTLVWLTVFGVATIFQVVLSSALGIAWAGAAVMLVSAVGGAVAFARAYSRLTAEQRDQLAAAREDREADERARHLARERADTRLRLEEGFAQLATDDAHDAIEILRDLEDEFDSIQASLARARQGTTPSLDVLLPGLTEEAYRRGMSALSDALEALERVREVTRRTRGVRDTADVESRLTRDEYADPDERARDELRLDTQRRNLERTERWRRNARELLFQAERCRDALGDAGDELVESRSGGAQIDVDAVIETLQQTIRRVRDVQEQFRQLGH